MPAQLTLDVVIVGANPNKSRVYYEGNYDPKDPAPPDCWSDNGIGPSDNALNPQNATCAGCPRAAWTKINANGNAVPWCQERKKAAVLVIGGGETVYLLSVPPKSHKSSLQPYIDSLRRQGADAADVVTTIGIKDKVWSFKEKGWLPNQKTYNFVREIVEGDIPANVVNAYDKPRQGLLPKPVAPKQIEDEIKEFVTLKVPEAPKIEPPKPPASQETQAKLDSLFAKFGPK
jgi:hypothetical protein